MSKKKDGSIDWALVLADRTYLRRKRVGRGPLPECPFLLAERAELAAAAIYRRLSRLFALQPEMRAFLGLMAAEEESHARRVREFGREWEERGCSEGPYVDTKRLGALVCHAERLRDKLDEVESIDEATALSLVESMETDFAVAHADVLARGCHPLLAAFFESLAEADQAHATLMREKAGQKERC